MDRKRLPHSNRIQSASKRSRNEIIGNEDRYKCDLESQQAEDRSHTVGRIETSTGNVVLQFGFGLERQGDFSEAAGTEPVKPNMTSNGDKYRRVGCNPFFQNLRTVNHIVPNSVAPNTGQPSSFRGVEFQPHAVRSSTQGNKSFEMPGSSQKQCRSREIPGTSSSQFRSASSWSSAEHGTGKSAKAQPGNKFEGKKEKLFDWDLQKDLLQKDLLASLTELERKRAQELQLQHEELPGVHFSRREWVTNWLEVDEEIAQQNFHSGYICFAITTYEADAILRSTKSRDSIITIVRKEMKKLDKKAKIYVEAEKICNPWYRYVYMRGSGAVIFGAIKMLHWFLSENVYKKFSADEYRRALPPRPPLSRRGVRPMILMAHFDSRSNQIAFNRGFCCECIKGDHVFCEFDHRIFKQQL